MAVVQLRVSNFRCKNTESWTAPREGKLLYFNDFTGKNGGRSRTRTCDPLIKSQLLYQLSYAPPGKEQEGHAAGLVVNPGWHIAKPRRLVDS